MRKKSLQIKREQETDHKIQWKNRRKSTDKFHIKAVNPIVWTFLTLLFSAVLILFSMFLFHRLIKARENTLLAGKGAIKQDSPVSGGLNNKKGEKIVLTAGEVEEIMENWNRRYGLVVHEPVEGQIAMSEAVKAVDEWLPKMGLSEGILSGNSTVRSSLNIAYLKGEKTEELSPTRSFWEVTVNGDKINGTFYVNAVTGQIFEAFVSLFSEPEGITKDQLLKSYIRLAGLKPEKNYDPDEVAIRGAESSVSAGFEAAAALGYGRMKIAEQTSETVQAGDVSGTGGFYTDGEDWSVSSKIADCNLTARVNCMRSWQYYDETGKAGNKKNNMKVTAQTVCMEIIFSLSTES